MLLHPGSRFLDLGRRLRAALVLTILFSGALIGQASKLLLYHGPGGPMQYNELGGILTDYGWETRVSVKFEVPEAIRIQRIKAWITGVEGRTATFTVSSVGETPYTLLSQTFQVEPVYSAPAKWQGVDSLKWDLQPGVYQFFMAAPDVPLGYGAQPPYPNLDSLLNSFDYQDYSEPDNIPWAPFGYAVYGTSLSAVPEPSFYGLMGGVGLLALTGYRRFRRTGRGETVGKQSMPAP